MNLVTEITTNFHRWRYRVLDEDTTCTHANSAIALIIDLKTIFTVLLTVLSKGTRQP